MTTRRHLLGLTIGAAAAGLLSACAAGSTAKPAAAPTSPPAAAPTSAPAAQPTAAAAAQPTSAAAAATAPAQAAPAAGGQKVSIEYWQYIDRITFHTNKSNYGPYGGHGGLLKKTLMCPADRKLVGFKGRHWAVVDSIQLMVL